MIIPIPEWQLRISYLVLPSTLNTIINEKSKKANSIWISKYNNKSAFEKKKYIEKYLMISKLKYIIKIIKCINENYVHIFSFSPNNNNLINTIKMKREELKIELHEFKSSTKFSKSEKKIIKTMWETLNKPHPNMAKEIGYVLIRLFPKDIALLISEYI